MKKICSVLLAVYLITIPIYVYAENTDYSYLEDMSVKELRALRDAIDDLLGDEKSKELETEEESDERLESISSHIDTVYETFPLYDQSNKDANEYMYYFLIGLNSELDDFTSSSEKESWEICDEKGGYINYKKKEKSTLSGKQGYYHLIFNGDGDCAALEFTFIDVNLSTITSFAETWFSLSEEDSMGKVITYRPTSSSELIGGIQYKGVGVLSSEYVLDYEDRIHSIGMIAVYDNDKYYLPNEYKDADKKSENDHKKTFSEIINTYKNKVNFTISNDGNSIIYDSNPSDLSTYETNTITLKQLHKDLGLPDSLYEKLIRTRAIDGMQSDNYGDIYITWSYHPDNGLEVLYEKK